MKSNFKTQTKKRHRLPSGYRYNYSALTIEDCTYFVGKDISKKRYKEIRKELKNLEVKKNERGTIGKTVRHKRRLELSAITAVSRTGINLKSAS